MVHRFNYYFLPLESVLVCKADCVARGQGSPSVLRFCFRLLGCLGEANLLAVTYFMSSLPDEHRHRGKDLGYTLLTVFHIRCCVPSLFGFHSGANRGSPSFLLTLYFSLSLSAFSLCHIMWVKIST